MTTRMLAIVLLVGSGFAQTIEQQLTQKLKGQILTFRLPAAGDKLRYDEKGDLERGSPGMRGIDDLITANSFSLHNDELEIKGTRGALLIDPYSGLAKYGIVNKIEISLKLPRGLPPAAAISAALNKVFEGEQEIREHSCNQEESTRFRDFVNRIRETMGTISAKPHESNVPAEMMCMLNGSRGYRYGTGITMPKVISAPDPVYPQALRQQRLQPTVHFIIRIDENGAVTDIVALAEPALAGAFTSGFVLRKWKFQPARVADKPVPAIVTVEINFRLY